MLRHKLRNNPVKSVPLDLLMVGYHWESVRERYFIKHNMGAEALEALKLRQIYARRIWDECGIHISVN